MARRTEPFRGCPSAAAIMMTRGARSPAPAVAPFWGPARSRPDAGWPLSGSGFALRPGITPSTALDIEGPIAMMDGARAGAGAPSAGAAADAAPAERRWVATPNRGERRAER